MPTIAELCTDLRAEHADLDRIVAEVGSADWSLVTPSPGWSVADQIGHLEYFDRAATIAITDPAGFEAGLAEVGDRLRDEGDDFTLEASRAMAPDALLAAWRAARTQLLDAASGLGEDVRLAWYGPPMSGQSFLTARLMETWAHGQDICDTVERRRTPTDRLRNIAHLGVITRGFTYLIRGREAPTGPVFVELHSPGGETWTWGPADADDQVTGSALDFCLVVTQRRHVEDTGLVTTGPLAAEWMRQAQAFAGGPSGTPAGGVPMTATQLSIIGGVATITLDEADNHNALSRTLVESLFEHLDAAIADPTARVVVVTNEGSTFCAGADLAAAQEGNHRAASDGLADVLGRILDAPKPVVGRIDGHCMGGGVGLAAACDISIAADSAKFGFTEARLGVAPAVISVVCLPKMRPVDASELFLRATRFSAATAAEVGLITRAVPEAALDAEVAAVTADIVRGGPEALAACKQIIDRRRWSDRSGAFEEMAEMSAALFGGDEAQEGIAAFRERRNAAWVPPGG